MSVRNWTYNCELTMPQIEMMMSDLPHTSFRRRKAAKGGPDADGYEESVRLNEESLRRFRERTAGKGLTVDEVFGGADDEV